MSLSVVPRSDQSPHMLVGVFDDTTTRKQAEDERKKFASLAENGTDFIGIASPDGRASFVNNAGRQFVGLTPDADVTKYVLEDFLAPHQRYRVRDEMLPALERDGHWEGETSFRNFRTDDTFPMWQHVFFILNELGQRMAIGTVSRDLSERRNSESRIAAVQSQVAHMARVTTMGELAATIAHEVNQPLAAVAANASACIQWLNAAKPDLNEVRPATNRISGEAKRASQVLGRIRTLMKQRHVVSEPVNLNDVALNVLDLVRPQIACHRISLRLNLAPILSLIRGDAIQLQQVVLNLLVNAIEASDGGQEKSPEIVLSTEGLKDSALMAIRDSGTGIGPDVMDEIFRPFYTTAVAGMGMGLSISRSILEAHAGKLWVTRNEGQGVTFRFSIPVVAHV